ncbi:putative membrane protein [Clostridium bornimense]|uniref:Putative membrane protein n=1 Tax=Clostridium bornimense TaxID=1216932 RepID=W6S093_9CLOT|nr:DUF3267 domain-containing protein [Clostridium bornimense]CDM70153.1 putative membrane protein [Clostridium bornimense]
MKLNQLTKENYHPIDKTISFIKLNIYGMLITLIFCTIHIIIYNIIWNKKVLFLDINLKTAIGIILGIFLHEYIHGFVWHFFCEEKWKSIAFGFKLKSLTPYSTCNEALPIKRYKLGVIAPFLITGALPYILAVILNNSILLSISLFMTAGACGDLIILFLLRNEKKSSVVIDHPKLAGCIVYRKN